MQSVGGGGGGPSRVGPGGRAASTSSAASPSSSSSAVSTPHLGFDSMQQQQIGSRQSLQQQLHRKPEGNEALLAYQASLQGGMGGNNFASSPGSMQLPQQRKFIELAQQHGSSHEGPHRSQAVEQQVLNPVHQAYLQYAFQAAQQKPALAMQSQQHAKMGMLGPPPGKDQDMRMGNLKMQDLVALQVPSQAQASSSRNSSEHLVVVKSRWIKVSNQPLSRGVS
ncbi:hypothetical protein SLA2020_351110 [Shorea laevis]